MKNKVIPVVIIVALVAVMGVCYAVFRPKPDKKDKDTSSAQSTAAEASESSAESSEAEETGEGAKSVTVEVTGADKATKSYTVKTDAEYLKGLMDELAAETDFEFSGSDGDFGFFIESINGETADYNVDGTYWAIYVNGEYGMYGADQQAVNDGDKFGFVREGGEAASGESSEGDVLGEGAKTVTVEVTDQAGETVAYTVKTDADYLKGLMDELAGESDFEFSGSDGDYGFFIESINGEVGDYSVDGTYWAIYVNGEYGMYGADQQVVSDGDSFAFRHEGDAA